VSDSRRQRQEPDLAFLTTPAIRWRGAWPAAGKPARGGKLHRRYVGRRTRPSPSSTSRGKLEIEFNPQGTADEALPRRRLRDPGLLHQDRRRTTRWRRARRPPLDGMNMSWSAGLFGDLAGFFFFSAFSHSESMEGDATAPRLSKAARNFNPMMATAARIVRCRVEEWCRGARSITDQVHTPGIFIKRIILRSRTTRRSNSAPYARLEEADDG